MLLSRWSDWLCLLVLLFPVGIIVAVIIGTEIISIEIISGATIATDFIFSLIVSCECFSRLLRGGIWAFFVHLFNNPAPNPPQVKF